MLKPAPHQSEKNRQGERGLNAVETAVLREGLGEALKILTLVLFLRDVFLVEEMWSLGNGNQVFWQQ